VHRALSHRVGRLIPTSARSTTGRVETFPSATHNLGTCERVFLTIATSRTDVVIGRPRITTRQQASSAASSCISWKTSDTLLTWRGLISELRSAHECFSGTASSYVYYTQIMQAETLASCISLTWRRKLGWPGEGIYGWCARMAGGRSSAARVFPFFHPVIRIFNRSTIVGP
jgi:hypothetical protein